MKLDILNVKIETLKIHQYETLKLHAFKKLKQATDLLMADQLDALEDMLAYSPSGGELGKNNYCINFEFSDKEFDDLQDVINQLRDLKSFTIYRR